MFPCSHGGECMAQHKCQISEFVISIYRVKVQHKNDSVCMWWKWNQSILSSAERGHHKILITQTTVRLMLNKSFLCEASPPFYTPSHINTQACLDSESCRTAALGGHTPQVTTPDNQTRTHAWPTNFYSLYLIWLQDLGEAGQPPWLLSQHAGFLLLLLPPPFPGLLYLHMPGSGTNQRAAWDALNRGCRHFITEALSSPRLGDRAEETHHASSESWALRQMSNLI